MTAYYIKLTPNLGTLPTSELEQLRIENALLMKAADDVYEMLTPTVERLIAEANGHELLSKFYLTAIVQISQFAKQKGTTVEQLGLLADTAIAKIAEKNSADLPKTEAGK